ncbi:MAG TPA: alpha/beta hydrolase [Burkholderiales bacterium]|jgi:pimeloyl-ACP methyl ester carboxylesterase|nr:alpha/beta hydrolase [Burkholderiales bacterium]
MKVRSNGIELEVEEQGPADGSPMVLIMGLGMQLLGWPDEFVDLLSDAGFRVIRFDNRDIGLSTKFDDWGSADLVSGALRHAFHLPVNAPYTLDDMAEDTVGMLDALGIARAHIVGASMGGMIAQLIAARHAARVASLSLIMTTSGARRLPGPTLKARLALLSAPANPNRIESVIDHGSAIHQVIASPGFPTEEALVRERIALSLTRSNHPRGIGRQLLAVAAAPDRTPLLKDIVAPTLVLHGRADPLVPVANGIDLAQHIAGAKLELIEGMGHDLPDALLPRLAGSIASHARAAHK